MVLSLLWVIVGALYWCNGCPHPHSPFAPALLVSAHTHSTNAPIWCATVMKWALTYMMHQSGALPYCQCEWVLTN